jgi:hypothetical protein
MNTKGIALLSAAALLAAGSATAGEMGGGSDISWTYAQVGYVQNDGSDYFESDGFDVMGSIALGTNWHAGASYSALSGDAEYYFGPNIDTDTWTLSVGYNAGLTKNSQAYLDLGYFDTTLDVPGLDGGEGDSSGFNLTAGFRYKPAPQVELAAALNYTNGSQDRTGPNGSDLNFNDTSIALTGQYFFVPEFSVGARANLSGGSSTEFGSSSDQFSIFARYSFGGDTSDMSDSSDASY